MKYFEYPKWLHFNSMAEHLPILLTDENFNSVFVENAEEESEILGAKVSNNDTIEALKDRALELGIKVDGRWSIERLKEEIFKAQ